MRLSAKLFSQSSRYFDVVIVGGGMVGSAMACGCGSTSRLDNKSVLLLEAGKGRITGNACSSYSNRVSAINPLSKRFFERIGIWDSLTADGKFKTVKQLRVWDSCSTSKIHFEYENFDKDVAYIIENNKIVEACLKRLNSDPKKITIRNEAKISRIRLPENLGNLVELELSDGTKFETLLVIGADGANSAVRSAMGGHYVSWSYNQKAIVATLDVNTVGDNSVAWQRFTPDGPVALLPLTDNKSSLVWTTTSAEADRLLALPNDQFVDSLNKILWEDLHQNSTANGILTFFDSFVGKLVRTANAADQLPPTVINVDASSRACFPLGFGHSTRYIKERAVLIGDAAHRMHPLAGQGVNLGFGDCNALIEILQRAVDEGADIGSFLHLKDYESKRQLKNLPVMLTMDVLNRLYSTEFLPIVVARSIGLNATNSAGFLKNFIMKQASI